MKVHCEHGFYSFEPEAYDDQQNFEAATGYKLVPYGTGLTFAVLARLPGYSLKGQPYGGVQAKANYCGHPAAVMRANGLVFDLAAQSLVALEEVQTAADLWPQNNGALIAPYKLPQAGARYDFKRLLSFHGVVRFGYQQYILRTYELG